MANHILTGAQDTLAMDSDHFPQAI